MEEVEFGAAGAFAARESGRSSGRGTRNAPSEIEDGFEWIGEVLARDVEEKREDDKD